MPAYLPCTFYFTGAAKTVKNGSTILCTAFSKYSISPAILSSPPFFKDKFYGVSYTSLTGRNIAIRFGMACV